MFTRPNPTDMSKIGRQKMDIVSGSSVGGRWGLIARRCGSTEIRNEAGRRHSVTDLGDGVVADLCATVRKSSERSS